MPCVVLTLCSMLCPLSMQCHRVIKLPLSHQHSEPASQNHSAVHFCKLCTILHHIIIIYVHRIALPITEFSVHCSALQLAALGLFLELFTLHNISPCITLWQNGRMAKLCSAITIPAEWQNCHSNRKSVYAGTLQPLF